MNTKETLNKVRTLLGIQVKLEQMKLDNGAVLEAETFEIGSDIFVVADEERVALPIGEYLTEDGMAILISEEGVIADIKQVDAEQPEAPAEVVEEEELQAEPSTPKKVIESVSTETFFSEIEKLRNEINELKLAKVEVKEIELAEVQGISHNPENVSAKKESNGYVRKSQNNTLNRIFNKLNN
jgi:hypothetical protein